MTFRFFPMFAKGMPLVPPGSDGWSGSAGGFPSIWFRTTVVTAGPACSRFPLTMLHGRFSTPRPPFGATERNRTSKCD